MSDFDRELRQAIKAGVDRSLEGWTFTPAMRQAVLERIAAEKEPAATPEPRRRQWLKPASWVAAAAAALILAVNLLPDRTGDLSGGAAPEVASTSGTERAGEYSAETARAMTGPGASMQIDALKIAGTEDNSGEAASAAPPDAVAMAAVPPGMVKVVLRVEELDAGAARHEFDIRADRQAAGEPSVVTQAAHPTNLDLAPLRDGNLVLLNSVAVQVVDQSGNVLAEEPLAQQPTALAEGPAAEPAVVSGNVVVRLNAGGRTGDRLELDEAPARVVVASDRTAVADARGVRVYAGRLQLLTLDGLQAEAVALAEDGSLAVVTSAPKSRLQVYSSSLALMMEQDVAADGSALAFLPGGSQVAVGSGVYDKAGRRVWSFPFAPEQIERAGVGGHVLAWNQQSAALVQTGTGEPVWLAEVGGGAILKAAAAPDSDLAAVVAADGSGVGVWVIDSAGAWLHAERLNAVPVDVAITGDHLHILMPDRLEVRPLGDENGS